MRGPLQYVRTSQGMDVFMFGHRLGTLVFGSASAWFRSPSRQGRLFPDAVTAIREIGRACQRAVDNGARP